MSFDAAAPNLDPPHVKPRQVIIVMSPKAGSGRGRDQIPRLQSLLTAQSIPTRLTDSIGELRRWLENDDFSQLTSQPRGLATDPRGSDCSPVIVAAGGDGTLSLVATHVPPHIPITPLPLGTENLLAHHFGITASADQLASTIASTCDIQLDVGSANGRMFLVVASAGFDAEVVRGMHLTRRGHIRRIDYLRPMLRAACRYKFPSIQTRLDDSLLQGPPLCWAMVFNLPRYAGNLKIEPDAIGDDGQLDLIGFTGGSVRSGLRYTCGILGGWHQSWRDVIRRRVTRIELTAPSRIPYQLDGDYVGRLPLVIETIPGRVRLRIPQKQQLH